MQLTHCFLAVVELLVYVLIWSVVQSDWLVCDIVVKFILQLTAFLVCLKYIGWNTLSLCVLDCVSWARTFFARNFHQTRLLDWRHDSWASWSSPVCWQRCNACFPCFCFAVCPALIGVCIVLSLFVSRSYCHDQILCLSVTLCIVAKWYILQQKCVKKWTESVLVGTWFYDF